MRVRKILQNQETVSIIKVHENYIIQIFGYFKNFQILQKIIKKTSNQKNKKMKISTQNPTEKPRDRFPRASKVDESYLLLYNSNNNKKKYIEHYKYKLQEYYKLLLLI